MVDYAQRRLMENGYEPYYLYRQRNILDNLENTGYCKPGKEGLYNVYIMDETHTILACGAGGVSKLRDPHGDCLLYTSSTATLPEIPGCRWGNISSLTERTDGVSIPSACVRAVLWYPPRCV